MNTIKFDTKIFEITLTFIDKKISRIIKKELVLAGMGIIPIFYMMEYISDLEIDAYIELNCKDLFWINDHCTELDRLKLDDFIVSFDYKAVRLFNLIMRDRVHVKILRVN